MPPKAHFRGDLEAGGELERRCQLGEQTPESVAVGPGRRHIEGILGVMAEPIPHHPELRFFVADGRVQHHRPPLARVAHLIGLFAAERRVRHVASNGPPEETGDGPCEIAMRCSGLDGGVEVAELVLAAPQPVRGAIAHGDPPPFEPGPVPGRDLHHAEHRRTAIDGAARAANDLHSLERLDRKMVTELKSLEVELVHLEPVHQQQELAFVGPVAAKAHPDHPLHVHPEEEPGDHEQDVDEIAGAPRQHLIPGDDGDDARRLLDAQRLQ